ncbi:MAG: hypothetical protein AAF554_05190 [Bacteroidota bacterium]
MSVTHKLVAIFALVLFLFTFEGSENTLSKASLFSFDATTVLSKVKQDAKTARLQRIKIATVVTKDVKATKKLYEDWLNHTVVEEGELSKAIANNWGAPKMAGKPYAIFQPESGDDVYLRIVEGTVPENYKAMTTYGWNAIELIVENPDSIYTRLLKSPFEHLGGPANLGDDGLSTIRAVQFKGPSEEVFYFTRDNGDASKSTLLMPRSPIDRPFIMVLAGSDARALTDFYVSNFGVKEAFFLGIPIPLVAKAQGLSEKHEFPLSLVRLSDFSNSIEIDGYPPTAGPRPTPKGELPPGVAIASFTIDNLDLINSDLFITSPKKLFGAGYNGNRAATIKGPAGELIELIEE